jgi:hypothetical protein
MAAAVRQGHSLRSVARQFGVSLLTVQRWVQRAEGQALESMDWSDRSRRPHQVANRTAARIEERVVALRDELSKHSDLGEYGAQAIHREMVQRGETCPPSVRTINRILERYGVFDARRRVRRPAPPPGWYLPAVAAGRAEIDLFDVVSGLVIEGGIEVEVLNAVSLHGGLIASWPSKAITAEATRAALVEHWQSFGRPTYVQFDNDTRFQGPHQHADVIGTVMRLCLSLSVVPVFAPVHETGFQAAVESLNNRWQQKVWARFHHESLEALQAQSAKYVAAARRCSAQRQEGAPARRAFPPDWKLNLHARPHGQVIFLRRTNAAGEASLLGHTFAVAPHWPHRLVRSEVELDQGVIRFFGLRRREPDQQPLLREVAYRLPNKGLSD